MENNYRENVVNLGDDASKMLYEACKPTWANRAGRYGEVIAGVDHFRGDREWSIVPLLEVPEVEKLSFSQEADGIGTKVLVSQQTATYDSAASNLFAMAADDAAAKGYEPVIITTDLNVNKLGGKLDMHMEQLARGAVTSAAITRVAMFGGETAILGDALVNGHGNPDENLWFIWGATVHAVRHSDRKVDGTEVVPGMALVGFKEDGFRSNGITSVRKTLTKHMGDNWHENSFDLGTSQKNLGQAVLQGSVIYTPVLVDAIGGYDVRQKGQAKIAGASHITGGGVWSKLGDLLNISGYGADIDNPYEPPEAMQLVQKLAGMSDYDLYGTLHGGQGMIVATPEEDKLIEVARKNNVEAQVIGVVTKEKGIRLRSAGVDTPGARLLYNEAA